MKIIRNILLILLPVALLSSCSVMKNSAFSTSESRLNLDMDDLEYLGDSELSVEYRTYLGFITAIDKINGEPYDGKVIKRFNVKSFGNKVQLSRRLTRASYKLVEDYPEGEYFIVTGQTKEKKVLFLGSDVIETAKVKVYSIR